MLIDKLRDFLTIDREALFHPYLPLALFDSLSNKWVQCVEYWKVSKSWVAQLFFTQCEFFMLLWNKFQLWYPIIYSKFNLILTRVYVAELFKAIKLKMMEKVGFFSISINDIHRIVIILAPSCAYRMGVSV